MISSSSYYWIPVRRIYKTYPVYQPDHEPEGYLDQLKTREPVEIWDTSTLKSEEDWVQAGKLVFEAPLFGGAVGSTSDSFQSSLYVRGTTLA